MDELARYRKIIKKPLESVQIVIAASLIIVGIWASLSPSHKLNSFIVGQSLIYMMVKTLTGKTWRDTADVFLWLVICIFMAVSIL